MTKQETFDTVVRALRAQGRKSTISTNSTTCMYRNGDGCKCAAGHLIPDALYDPAMEGIAVMADDQSVDYIALDRRQRVELVRAALRAGGHDLALTRDLQGAHDNADNEYFVASFTRLARDVAADHGLSAEACG